MKTSEQVSTTPRLTDPRFDYTPAAGTDVTKTWRRFGWRPMTEYERREKARKQMESDDELSTAAGIRGKGIV